MPSRNTGTVKTRLAQNRRLMSSSSGLLSSSDTARGSSAMPQMGHDPGPFRTICGCMGQVHSVPGGGGDSAFFGPRYLCGSASNFALHLPLQKPISRPW